MRKGCFAGILSIEYSEILFFILLFEISAAFNIDVHAPLLKNGPPRSNFGFSLLGYTRGDDKRGLVIGSPTGGVDGEIYWCPPLTSTCDRVDVDVAQIGRTTPGLNGSLFGYSMSSLHPESPGKLAVCAPRLSKSSVSMLFVTGGCFQLDKNLAKPELNSASRAMCQDIQDAPKRIDLRHCTMGATVGQHPAAPDDLFMGGPYFYYAQGMGAIVDTAKFTRVTTSKEDINQNTLLGSSLDISKRIFAGRDGSERPLYVVFGGPGVPSSLSEAENVGTGLVLFYRKPLEDDHRELQPVLRLDGTQFGSRFGHALALLDINGDGWDDLIVGAPYHYLEAEEGSQPNYGAASVFLNQQGRFAQPVDDQAERKPFAYQPNDAYQLLTPKVDDEPACKISSLSGYGAAINALGDINRDGYQDFAVGAPFGEHGGVVFIYHGSKTGRIGPPAQVICGKNIMTQQPLYGLGFAMGLKGLDLDGNNYPDVAIGAPMSDTVVVLRARPIIQFQAHITLPDGTTELPSDLEQLRDCRYESRLLPGYHSPKVRCAEARVFVTYTSIDDIPCDANKRYRVNLILKSDPVDMWLLENWDTQQEQQQQQQESLREREKRQFNYVCGRLQTSPGQDKSDLDEKRSLYQKYAIPPVSFVGERTVVEFGAQAERYFRNNRSAAAVSGLASPGGYLPLEVWATCRERRSSDSQPDVPSFSELKEAQKVQLLFRDVDLVDQTKPLLIGAKWIAQMPDPYPSVNQIDQYPIADPRANTQLLKFTFKNPCFEQTCCPRIKVEYLIDVTRDKNGPVVHVGDDKAQTIEVRATVTNLGSDPAYMVNLISNFPSMLLELDPRVGTSLRPDAAICHLANPLRSGESAQCALRWLVVGHQLTVQMAYFYVNSTVVLGSSELADVVGSLTNQLRVNIKMVVNVSISGSIEPSTAYFSGNVSDGISSIVAENHIGNTRLLAKFTVRNLRRHSLIPASRLIIDWPYEIAGDVSEPHGKYLLYLLETPRVIQHLPTTLDEQMVNATSVVCDSRALERLVNPHNYRVFSSLQKALEGVPVRTEPVDLPESHPTFYPPLSSSKMLEPVPARLSDNKAQTERKMTTVSCYNGALRCVPIACDLGKLSYKAGPITLQFSARLWDNTMRQDFKDIFLTKLRLSATWRADVKYGIDLDGLDHAQETVELQIFNNLEPKPIPPRYMGLYIGLAVFGGVLLLALLVLILYKAGFFKRKRFFRKQPRGEKPASVVPTTGIKSQPQRTAPATGPRTPAATATARPVTYQPLVQTNPPNLPQPRSAGNQPYVNQMEFGLARGPVRHAQGPGHVQAWDD